MKGIVVFLVLSVALLTAAFYTRAMPSVQSWCVLGALFAVNGGMIWHVTRK